jgi:phage terminase large subunit
MYRETPEAYAQEYECDFAAAISGAYFGKQMQDAEEQGRITTVERLDGQPVHTAWDLGIGDATAIWAFQVLEHEIRVIGYYENHGKGADHYVSECVVRGWNTGTCWFPHDVRVREWGSRRTRIEQLVEKGVVPALVPAHRVEDGINATRMTLPLCVFDADACRDGLEHLRQYRPDFDERKQCFSDRPRHDEHSHGADAMRYLCMGYRKVVPESPKEREPVFKGFGEMSIVEYFRASNYGGKFADDDDVAAREAQDWRRREQRI